MNEFQEIEPDEKYWHVTRSILLSTIEVNNNERQGFQFKSLFFNVGVFTRTVFPTMKMATISLVVMAMILVTGLGAQAAGPDNFLFDAKLAIERTKVLFAKDANKTELHFDYINNRLEEIDQLIAQDKSNHIAKATQNIELNLKQVKKNLELMKNNKNVDARKVVELATLIDLKTNELSESLKEKTIVVENKKIAETIKASNSLSKDALELIVSSDTELADAELELIENSINNKIEIEKERFEGIGEKITKVQNDIIKEEELKIEESMDVDVNTSTSTSNQEKTVEFNIDEISNINSEEIADKLEESKKLLESDDYKGAIRELNIAELYINLTDQATNEALEDYESEIEELESEIEEEVKGVTEQVLE